MYLSLVAVLLSLSESSLLMASLSVSHASSTLMILPCTRRPLSFSTTQRAWSGSRSGLSHSMCTKVSRALTYDPSLCCQSLCHASDAWACWLCSPPSVSNAHLHLAIAADSTHMHGHTGVSLGYGHVLKTKGLSLICFSGLSFTQIRLPFLNNWLYISYYLLAAYPWIVVHLIAKQSVPVEIVPLVHVTDVNVHTVAPNYIWRCSQHLKMYECHCII